MPRSSAPAIVIVNTLLIPLGAVTLVAGIVGASRVAEIRWLFVLLAAVHGIVA